MRLDKAVSLAGLSRSEAKDAIKKGRVCINGIIARDAAMRVEATDAVTVDSKPVDLSLHRHIMLNKPSGVITATEDTHGERTVIDLLPREMRFKDLGPVGRLDKDVTGLVILTTDGVLAHRLISPKHDAKKQYIAKVEGRLTQNDIDAFAAGLDLGDFIAKPAKLEIDDAGETVSLARVFISEGKFHQVKRMFSKVGHEVLKLKRISIAGLTLDETLADGESRALTPDEIRLLYEAAGMEAE